MSDIDYSKLMKFIARVDRLELRFRGSKFANDWLVPKEELIAVRNALIDSPFIRKQVVVDLEVREDTAA